MTALTRDTATVRADLERLGNGLAAEPRSFASVHSLSPRQLKVLLLACEGLSNAEIAARLGLRPSTVRVHMARVRERLAPDGKRGRWLAPVALELGALRERRRQEGRR